LGLNHKDGLKKKCQKSGNSASGACAEGPTGEQGGEKIAGEQSGEQRKQRKQTEKSATITTLSSQVSLVSLK